MRSRLVDIPRSAGRYGLRASILGWWIDFPPRCRDFWSLLLFQPGQGWLRWAEAWGSCIVGSDPGESENYIYIPLLRRAWYLLEAVVFVPYAMTLGTRQDEGRRYRWSWAEARPCTGGSLWTDPDRRYSLWRYK